MQCFRGKPFGVFQILVWLLILIPLGVYLAYLPRFGYLQNNDYYWMLLSVLEGERFSQDPGVWVGVQANEHLAFVPTLIYAANILWNHGNNRALTLFSLALMAVVFTLLYRRLPEAEREDPWLRLFFGLSLSVFVFTPVAAHNVAMGFSGTQWFLANVLAMTAITLLSTRGDAMSWRSWSTLYGAFLAGGVVGVFSYTTHLSVWPALLLGVYWLGLSRWHYGALSLCGLLCVGIFAWHLEPLTHHSQHNARDGLGLLEFMGVYLGSPFTQHFGLAKGLAFCGLLVTGALHLTVLRGPLRVHRRMLAPWLMVQVYALVSALGTALGRLGLGQSEALSSRYATLPGLFWAALFVALGLLVRRSLPGTFNGRKRWALLAVGSVWMASLGATFVRGIPVMEKFADRASRQEVTTLMLLRGYRDTEILPSTVIGDPQEFWQVHDALRALGHVPFDRTLPEREHRRIPPDLLRSKPSPELEGAWHSVVPIAENPAVVRVLGWAHAEGCRVADVVLVDADGVVHSDLVVGIEWGQLSKTLGVRSAGWEGYVEREAWLSGLTVYARQQEDSAWYPLRENPRIQSILEEFRASKATEATDLE